MSKKLRNNLIFALIVLLFVGFFGYREISKRLSNAQLQRQVKRLSSNGKSDFKNTAEAVTLIAQGQKEFVVGEDMKAGIYDISTDSDAMITANIMINKDTPSKNIMLSDGQKVQISEKGSLVLKPSKIEALKTEGKGEEMYYIIPAQGFYYEGSQIPAGKYELVTENLPVIKKRSKMQVKEADVSIGNAYFSKEGYLVSGNVENTNSSQGKHRRIVFTLRKNQFVEALYSLPPKNLVVKLKALD
ncbi:MAG: hypothetical protein LBV19_10485 [Streptococcaceae bacterium]|jgi:hypothetical protein|nr:hypothetical protein [Streptococcaceae bacterium]